MLNYFTKNIFKITITIFLKNKKYETLIFFMVTPISLKIKIQKVFSIFKNGQKKMSNFHFPKKIFENENFLHFFSFKTPNKSI